jgi:hypothetical protein
VKRLLPIFIFVWTMLTATYQAPAADVTMQTNAIGAAIGDSYWYAPDQDPITGNRAVEYMASGLKLMFPYKNTHLFNFSRSGLNMDIALSNNVTIAMGLWGYQSNSFQHFGWLLGTDNGSLSSNQMYLANSNIFLAPALISNGGLTLTNNGGQYAKPIDWVGFGYPPNASSDGAPSTEGARNNASVNAGNNLGVRGVDGFNVLSNGWVTDYNANGGTNVDWVYPSGIPHFLSGGAKSEADASLAQMFPSRSNLTTCVVDWNGAIVTTNNCLVTSVSAGASLSFDCIEYSMGAAWDHPGDVVADGTITNNADKAFNLVGNYCEYFKQILQITNLPAGNYYVKEDGEIIATLSSTVLAAGWNRGTNTTGPSWRKRVKVLADIRKVTGVNQVSLHQNATGIFAYGSASTAVWPGTQGDALIAAMNTPAAACFTLDDTANTDAQPVTRHLQIVPTAIATIITVRAATTHWGQ